MKCHYRVDGDETWIEGRMCTIDGATALVFARLASHGGYETTHRLRHIELLVNNRSLVVTGFMNDGDDKYELLTVEVMFNKPRKALKARKS